MTATTAEIFIPCTPLTIKVQVGSSTLTYLEQMCLRAIGSGIQQIAQLSEFLPIGSRPLYDLLFGLWRQGHVLINVQSGQVRLGKVDLEKLDTMRSTTNEYPIEIVQERVTGRFLPLTGSRASGPPQYRIAEQVPFELKPEMYAEIVKTVELADRRRRSKSASSAPDRTILDIRIDPQTLRPERGLRWIRARVDCLLEEGSDQLRVFLLDGLGLDGLGRRGIERALDELAHDRPGETPFSILRERARPMAPALPLPTIVDNLIARTERLHEVDRGVVAAMHDELIGVTHQATSALAAAERVRAELDLVIGHEDHEQFIRAAVDSASEQLLLCCPFVDFAAIQRLYHPLEEALRRGVQVHLMWGIALEDELEGPIARLIDAIRHGRRSLHISRRSCRTHAKLLVCDHREALVTSYNFLSPSSAATLEIGVRVRSPGVCAELLDWATRNHTDYQCSRTLVTAPAERPAGTTLPPLAAPALPGLEREDAFVASDIRLWIQAWQSYAADLRSALSRMDCQVNTISNAEHVGLLWEAIQSARQRLVITSDALRSDVVSERLIGALHGRLATDPVEILLVYRRAEDRVADLVDQLAEIEARYPRFQVIRADTHCKLLVCDDRVVVTSFNFLSFSGFYGVGSGQQRLRERSELGVVIGHRPFADAVVDGLRARLQPRLALDFHPTDRRGVRVDRPGTATLARIQKLVEAVREATGQAERRRKLVEHFRASATPWADLDLLGQARLPEAIERDAICACLHALPADRELDQRGRRIGQLAAWAWRRSLFWEATTLLALGKSRRRRTASRPGRSASNGVRSGGPGSALRYQ